MAEAAGIFVSHAHEDNAWCRTFVEALRQAGANIWYDEHNLGYGTLGDEIERELRTRPIFIVILSPSSVGKPWVRREMNAAIGLRDETSDRIILPVVAEKTEIPLFWREYKRVAGPNDQGLLAVEAAGRVVHTLGIVPANAASVAPPPAATETADEAWQRGKGLRAQKRYAEALAAYERAINLEPGIATYWNSKGVALDDLKRYEEALAAFEQALTLDPKYVVAWTSKGDALYKLQRYEESISADEQALTLDPKSRNAWTGKGNALYGLKRYEEALAAYEQALTLGETSARWRNKANTLRVLGRTADAEDAERRAKELGA